MPFYQDLGFLILGSRLRRLSEYYIAEVNKVYRELGIPFDASWFPVFYILSKKKTVSLTDIASALSVSHSAVSQLIKKMKSEKLVTTFLLEKDKRHQMVELTPKGSGLLEKLKPVWKSMMKSEKMLNKAEAEIEHLLPSLLSLEKYFQQESLSGIILKNMKS